MTFLILIKNIIFKFSMSRRREWDMSEEAESTAELVKNLQRENTELCDKERRRVQDDREKEGDLDKQFDSNERNDKEVVFYFFGYSSLGFDF